MATGFYTVGKVLLAFRDEYQEQRKKLQELKQFITVKDLRVSDTYFDLSINPSSDNLSIVCDFILKKGIVSSMVDEINKIKGLPEEKIYCDGSYLLDFDSNPIIKTRYNYRVIDEDGLLKKVEDIYKSDFVKNINSSIITEYGKIDINCSWITISVGNEKLTYVPNGDIMYTSLAKYKEDKQFHSLQLRRTLDTLVPKDSFNEYQTNVIQNSENAKKKIVFFGYEKLNFDKWPTYHFDDSSLYSKVMLKRVKSDSIKYIC